MLADDLPASVSVAVGAGGVNSGARGGNSSFHGLIALGAGRDPEPQNYGNPSSYGGGIGKYGSSNFDYLTSNTIGHGGNGAISRSGSGGAAGPQGGSAAAQAFTPAGVAKAGFGGGNGGTAPSGNGEIPGGGGASGSSSSPEIGSGGRGRVIITTYFS